MVSSATKQSPRLQLRCFAIQNFRTFRNRTVVEFEPDVTVFHGETGSGKSTALVALGVFFDALGELLSVDANRRVLPSGKLYVQDRVLMTDRDRPMLSKSTTLEATFAHDASSWVQVHIEPAGPNLQLRLEWASWENSVVRRDLVERLFAFGAASRSFARLDARRRPAWLNGEPGTSLLAPALANELYALSTSKLAADRERWRSFAATLSAFPTLLGATITIEAGDPPELVIEHPGRLVLGVEELSSGEQELAALTAGLLLARAPVVAIEEPEMGLDVRTQALWKDVCERQRAAGFVHQLIFESHQPTFDGPRVVRFRRDASGNSIVEKPLPSAAGPELAERAKEKGAKPVFVTSEGYTQLPETLRAEMGLGESGAHLWFLPGKNTWEAWPEQKLEDLLADKPK
jgi:hypothetical protein